MLVQKNVWDFIEIRPQEPLTVIWEYKKKIKENQMVVDITTWIIKEGIRNDIFNNIIDIANL